MGLSNLGNCDARQVANEFIRLARERGRPLTQVHIQKLIYLAHARMLVLHRTPLIGQSFQAWELGPVVRDVYRVLKHNNAEPILDEIPLDDKAVLPNRIKEVIDWTLRRYGHLRGPELITLTHAPDSPWASAMGTTGAPISNPIIPNATIEGYYVKEWREDSLATLNRLSNIPSIRDETLASIASGNFPEGYTLDQLEELVASRGRRS